MQCHKPLGFYSKHKRSDHKNAAIEVNIIQIIVICVGFNQ